MGQFSVKIALFGVVVLFVSACALQTGATTGRALLLKNEVLINNDKSDKLELSEIPIQQPNEKIAGVRLQNFIYRLAVDRPDSLYNSWLQRNPKTNQFFNAVLSEKQTQRLGKSFVVSGWSNMFKELGEPPRYLDEKKIEITNKRFQSYFSRRGYFNTKVFGEPIFNEKKNKAKVVYKIETGTQYLIDSLSVQIDSPELKPLYEEIATTSKIKKGTPYYSKDLETERERITTHFRDKGVYHFQTNNITYVVDTVGTDQKANIKILIKDRIELSGDTTRTLPFRIYKINAVNVFIEENDKEITQNPIDTLTFNGVRYYSFGKLKYRPKALSRAIFLEKGQLYSDGFRAITNGTLSNLKAFEYPSIQYEIDKKATEPSLTSNVYLKPKDKYSFSIGSSIIHSYIEDVGFTFDTSIGVRNLFRGAEMLELSGRGNIGSSKDFSRDTAFFNLFEYGMDLKLTIPRLITPVGFRKWVPKRMLPTTLVSLGFFKQHNIGLDKQNLVGLISYNWQPKKTIRAQFDLLNVQYIRNVNKPNYFNIYATSYERLNEISKVYNANLSYLDTHGNLLIESGTSGFINDVLTGATSLSSLHTSYQEVRAINERKTRLTENNLIAASNFQITLNTKKDLADEQYYSFKTKIESAGLLMTLLSRAEASNKNLTENRTLYDVDYSQYAKVEFEYAKHWDLYRKRVLAFRIFSGIAIPYGNSNNIPFSRSYFAGGANDNRAWQPYRVGPGRSGSLNDFNEANFKIALNLEYRFKIYNQFHGALFVDSGNVWNVLDDVEDVTYQFRGFESLIDVAVGSGLGLRYDFSFFVFRLDVGFKNYDPSYTINQRWSKGYSFDRSVINIGVNYPF